MNEQQYLAWLEYNKQQQAMRNAQLQGTGMEASHYAMPGGMPGPLNPGGDPFAQTTSTPWWSHNPSVGGVNVQVPLW